MTTRPATMFLRMALRRAARDRRRPEIARRVDGYHAVHRGGPRGRQGADDRRFRALTVAVDGAEKPQFVLDEKAAELHPRVPLSLQIRHRRGRLRPLVAGVLIDRQTAALNEAEHRTLEDVAAALGDDVDNAARDTAVIGRQTARLDLDFLNEVVVQ